MPHRWIFPRASSNPVPKLAEQRKARHFSKISERGAEAPRAPQWKGNPQGKAAAASLDGSARLGIRGRAAPAARGAGGAPPGVQGARNIGVQGIQIGSRRRSRWRRAEPAAAAAAAAAAATARTRQCHPRLLGAAAAPRRRTIARGPLPGRRRRPSAPRDRSTWVAADPMRRPFPTSQRASHVARAVPCSEGRTHLM